jgi:steroid delta-isomerase-like uncharacterized protein
LIKKHTDAWNSHDIARFVSEYTDDAVIQDPGYPEPLSGKAAVEKDARDFTAACPDTAFRVTKVISEGNTAALEGIWSGTQTGPLELPTGLLPATNKRIELTMSLFIDMDASGRIRSERRYYDVAVMLAQLGLMQ